LFSRRFQNLSSQNTYGRENATLRPSKVSFLRKKSTQSIDCPGNTPAFLSLSVASQRRNAVFFHDQ